MGNGEWGIGKAGTPERSCHPEPHSRELLSFLGFSGKSRAPIPLKPGFGMLKISALVDCLVVDSRFPIADFRLFQQLPQLAEQFAERMRRFVAQLFLVRVARELA
jgi:hypothetical protein